MHAGRRTVRWLLAIDWFYVVPVLFWPPLNVAALWLLNRWCLPPGPGDRPQWLMWEVMACALGLSFAIGGACMASAVAAERFVWMLRFSRLGRWSGFGARP